MPSPILLIIELFLCCQRAESESESTISTAVLGASSSSSSSIAAVAAAAAENPVNASSDAADVSVSEEVPSPLASSSQDPDQGPKEGKKKKNRCLSCKKKVGLTGEDDFFPPSILLG